jgi:hypothetical protein
MVLSRRALRGTVLALAVALSLLPAQTAAAMGWTEAPASELPAADPTMLVVRPLCRTHALHRFAVDNVEGPATQFTVSVAGREGETLLIGAGETRNFWVDAERPGAVEIGWAGGSASTTGVDEACDPDIVPPDVPFPALSEIGTPVATPSTATSPSPRSGSEASAPPTITEMPDFKPTPPAQHAKRSGQLGSATEAPGEGGPGDTGAEPPPRIVDGVVACPDGWVAVDSDVDGRFEPSDNCEALVETAARASVPGAAFPAVALLVTIGLLIASISLGAVSRRRA